MLDPRPLPRTLPPILPRTRRRALRHSAGALFLAVPLVAGATSPSQGAPAAPAPTVLQLTIVATATVSPGVTSEELSVGDGTATVLAHVVRVDTAVPGIGFDLASGRKVASRHPVADVMDADAVAGVNGDFFDIRDTDAPLGVAVDQQRGLRNGVASGWNDAFWVGADSRPHIGPVTVRTTVAATPGHPAVTVAAVDSPLVPPGGIGLYDRHFGTLRHRLEIDGQRRGVRLVVVRGGRVVANRTRLPAVLRVHGTVLIGRDAGAVALSRLDVGERVRATSRLSEAARVVITGSDYLLRDGSAVTNTSPDPSFVGGLYPRTAVGIDDDTGEVILATVDGRSATSPGYSLAQMTTLMQQLGANDALNLDGGGSSTLLTRGGDGALAVVNTPSDGHPRAVANGLEVTYDPAG